LLVCTNRVARYRVHARAGDEEIPLATREVLLLGAETAVANISMDPYESIGFIFYPDSLRVYGIRYAPEPRDEAPDPLRLQHHNYVHPAPLGEDGRRLLDCALHAQAFPATGPYRRHLVAALLTQILVALRQTPPLGSGKAARTFRILVRHVEAHLAEPIDRAALARSLRLHPNHVSRLFRRFTNGTFTGFLRNLRLDRAEGLLRSGESTVTEAAYACGFGSSSAFIRAFRARHGVPPGQWGARTAAASPRSIVQ
jgi:AraC-like DNA-binding protein